MIQVYYLKKEIEKKKQKVENLYSMYCFSYSSCNFWRAKSVSLILLDLLTELSLVVFVCAARLGSLANAVGETTKGFEECSPAWIRRATSSFVAVLLSIAILTALGWRAQ